MAPATNISRAPPDARQAESLRKAVLFCPKCDHESHPGGDWIRRTLGDTEVRRCPDCKAVVERRPLFGGERRARQPAFGPLVGAVRSTQSILLTALRGVARSARAVTA